MLSDSESDQDDINSLSINEHYAKAFEYKKEREELEKLKAKYGSDFEDEEGEGEEDSESDEDEDSDGEELTPAVDAAILRTLARIKKKDADIYDSSKNVFEQEQAKLSSKDLKRARKEKSDSKPVTLRQVVLDAQLHSGSRSPTPEPQTFVEEQKALQSETIAAFHEGVGGDEEEEDFLILREKTQDELEREEEEYREFLEREVGKDDLQDLVTIPVDDVGVLEDPEEEEPRKKDKKKKQKKKKVDEADANQGKSKEDADQDFLMNYILNRGWIDRESRRIPTYSEITSSKKKKGKEKAVPENKPTSEPEASASEAEAEADDDEANDSDLSSEAFDDIVDRFESSYNFRFEEPDATTIKTYPRILNSTVRREESTRKDARARRKQRKEEELQERREEVRRLKALKMKELRSKLDKISEEGGKKLDDVDPALQELDLEGDWDPSKHDEQMAALYGGEDRGDGDADLDEAEYDGEKPVWDDDIDIGDIVPDDEDGSIESKKKKKKKKKKDEVEEDEGVDIDAMDADATPLPMDDDEEWDGTEEMRKRKLDEYMDEIYGLDFNDMVGGMPTRFKYVPVHNHAHGLSAVDILMASDKELNEYMSVKKYAPYRTAADRKWDSSRSEKLRELKSKVSERTGGANLAAAGDGEQRQKKRMGKKERMKLKADIELGENDEGATAQQDKKRKRDPTNMDDNASAEAPTNNANGTAAKKRKRKHKKKSLQGADD